ncbi:MFS transporter, partial [Burkholderia cenocepacia]|nr:MFS transporter [Burkholderia cenocepacia]
LFGLALSPIIATQLLGFVSWRWVFALVAVPGLVLGAIMVFVIREPKVAQDVASEHAPASLGHVLKRR